MGHSLGTVEGFLSHSLLFISLFCCAAVYKGSWSSPSLRVGIWKLIWLIRSALFVKLQLFSTSAKHTNLTNKAEPIKKWSKYHPLFSRSPRPATFNSPDLSTPPFPSHTYVDIKVLPLAYLVTLLFQQKQIQQHEFPLQVQLWTIEGRENTPDNSNSSSKTLPYFGVIRECKTTKSCCSSSYSASPLQFGSRAVWSSSSSITTPTLHLTFCSSSFVSF